LTDAVERLTKTPLGRTIVAVKSPKKPSKEPSLPSQDEARRANVLMEQMLSKFDAFGEALSAVREDVNSMKPDLHAVKEDVAVMKSAVRTNGQDIRSLNEAVQGNTEAIHAMQTDLKNINQRLEVVEAKS
jgi:chromosome segregation ATPase